MEATETPKGVAGPDDRASAGSESGSPRRRAKPRLSSPWALTCPRPQHIHLEQPATGLALIKRANVFSVFTELCVRHHDQVLNISLTP